MSACVCDGNFAAARICKLREMNWRGKQSNVYCVTHVISFEMIILISLLSFSLAWQHPYQKHQLQAFVSCACISCSWANHLPPHCSWTNASRQQCMLLPRASLLCPNQAAEERRFCVQKQKSDVMTRAKTSINSLQSSN